MYASFDTVAAIFYASFFDFKWLLPEFIYSVEYFEMSQARDVNEHIWENLLQKIENLNMQISIFIYLGNCALYKNPQNFKIINKENHRKMIESKAEARKQTTEEIRWEINGFRMHWKFCFLQILL